MDAVQRLYGSRFQCQSCPVKAWVSFVVELKIESGPPEMEPWDERPNQPGAYGGLIV